VTSRGPVVPYVGVVTRPRDFRAQFSRMVQDRAGRRQWRRLRTTARRRRVARGAGSARSWFLAGACGIVRRVLSQRLLDSKGLVV
jgi:hypothetical protein